MKELSNKLSVLLADTYALYLKTQCYHWHVTGPHFKTLHELFEEQYRDLAEAADALAERIRMAGFIAPASFKAFLELTNIKDGNPTLSANEMLKELAVDHKMMIRQLTEILSFVETHHDEASVNLLSERIAKHEKMHWMLKASIEQ